MLIINLKINEDTVALAVAQNVSSSEQGVVGNSYSVSATTTPNPYGIPAETKAQHVHITNHDRSENIWALVAKIATQLAEK